MNHFNHLALVFSSAIYISVLAGHDAEVDVTRQEASSIDGESLHE